MNIRKPYIVSISAISGGGKTTVTHQLCELLPRCKAVYFDDYDFDECPDDLFDWFERGSNYNEWDITPLANDLISLKNDSRQPLDYILLDYPFSRFHEAISSHIDFTVYIDTPLDIAMARRILRDFKDKTIVDLQNDMNNYLIRGRSVYVGAQIKDRSHSDLILDGSQSSEFIVKELYEIILSR